MKDFVIIPAYINDHIHSIIIKSNKIKNVYHNLKENYDHKILKLITEPMKKHNGPASYLFIGDSDKFLKDLAKELNFEIFNLTSGENIPKLFHKIKYLDLNCNCCNLIL